MSADLLTAVVDVLAWLLLLGGAFLTFTAGVAVLRFPDLLARTHAATKPQVLGLVLTVLGLALRLRTPSVLWVLVLVVLFQLITSPIAAHMVSRAGFRTGKVPHDLLVADELTRDVEAARDEAADHAGPGPSAAEEARREP